MFISRNVRQIQATQFAFAAILDTGCVVTWGHDKFGGDSSAVQERLRNVRHIQATKGAFAAILEDLSVVTWGSAGLRGESSSIQVQLQNQGLG